MKDLNTAEYWNYKWQQPGNDFWANRPETFKLICALVGSENKILDLGSGVGILANELQKNKNDVYCLDISEEAIKEAKRRFNLPGIVAKVPPLPFKGRCFDVITATEFLEHFPDPTKILAETSIIAKVAVFGVPNNTLKPKNHPEHMISFDRTMLRWHLKQFYEHVEIHEIIEKITTRYPDILVMPSLIAKAWND